MQPRKNSLPIILVVLGVIIVAVICGCTLLSLGIITSLFPIRVISSPANTSDVPVPVATSTVPISNVPGVPVYDVRVEIGVGSPIPVEVVASGEWSSTCAQLDETNIRYIAGNQIHIELLSDPGPDSCPVGMEGLPFNFRIPLNMAEMPSGEYSVNVNGVQTDFEWNGPNTQGYFPDSTQASNTNLLPVSLLDVQVEVGVGSPIPVEIAVAGEWPTLCSQLGQMKTKFNDQVITIDLLATPADASCPPDMVGLPFGLRIPLNMANMPAGNYTVTVNGVQASFDWPYTGKPQFTELAPMRLAFIGPDGNVWLVDQPSFDPFLVTSDATALNTTSPSDVQYNEPRLSSDGRFVAYRRGITVQQGDITSMDFGLWVANLETGDSQEIYAMSSAGYSWQPGNHLLAYTPELEGPYFTTRGSQPDSAYAKGIMGYNADSGETSELVRPERGYALNAPAWSPDGRFLSFDEIINIEGRGPFAYYDFSAGKYIAWGEPLGMYSWSPDGEALAYDNMTYTATGDERIYIRTRQGGGASEFSRDFKPGYATMPVFSPLGDQIAYLVNSKGPDNQSFTLNVQPYPQGEPVALGEFENVYLLNWSPDGKRLILSSGIWGTQSISIIYLLSGEITQPWQGMQPSISLIP